MSQNLFWPPLLNRIIFLQILFQKYKCVHVLLLWTKFHWKIPLGKLFFKSWSCDYFCETRIHFLAAILRRNIFLMFFLLIYCCFKCIQIWCKFRTELPTGKYLKMNESEWTHVVHKREWKVLALKCSPPCEWIWLFPIFLDCVGYQQ